MVKGQHFHLRYHPRLFLNSKWHNIKASLAHHSIIQKEVDDVLAKNAIELSTVGLAFTGMCLQYLNI